jgi:hypothetical protein
LSYRIPFGELEKQRVEEQMPLSRSEAVKSAVLEELEKNFPYKSERGAATMTEAAALPTTWWVKQAEKGSARNNQTTFFNA